MLFAIVVVFSTAILIFFILLPQLVTCCPLLILHEWSFHFMSELIVLLSFSLQDFPRKCFYQPIIFLFYV